MKSFESLEVICDHHNDGAFTIDMHLRAIRGLAGTHPLGAWACGGPTVALVITYTYMVKGPSL